MDDGLVEGPETFNVTLTSDDDVVLVPAMATVVIQELDSEWALVYSKIMKIGLKIYKCK